MARTGIRAVGAVLAAIALVFTGPGTASADDVTPLPSKRDGCLPPPTATATDLPWGLRQLAPSRVWPFTKGANVVVAVVDTGVDGHIPQLAGRVLPGVDVVKPGGRADTDCYGHGTFVAGIVAAAPASGTAFTGVAPGSKILPVRVATSGDDVTAEALALGIRAGVDNGATVINVSASTTVATPALKDAVAYAEAHDVVVVASAANSATNGDPVTYPASYPTVIAVGAVDSNGQRADFSQTGPYLGLVAPGVNVVSLGPGGPGHWQGSGTSYASPFVAGAAALVRAYHPKLSAAQVRERLETTADHPARKLPDNEYGWGTVNPLAAVTAVLPAEGSPGAKIGPHEVRAPATAGSNSFAAVLTAVGLVGAAAVMFALRMGKKFGSVGRRRRWRPAREVTVVNAERLSPASHGPSGGDTS